MQKTKVINATGTKITVKMSNNGIVTQLRDGDVESGDSCTISIDPNATYREYWCAVPPNTNPDSKVILSSDDCADFLEVTIFKDASVDPPTYYWTGTKHRKKNLRKQAQGSPSTAVATPALASPPGANGKSCLIM